MRVVRYFVATLFSFGICAADGESSSPELTWPELPAAVLSDCASDAVTCTGSDFTIGWVAHLPRRDLFLARRTSCEAKGCRGWLVAKDEHGTTRVLLAITGEVRLERGRGDFPMVRTRSELSDSYVSYARYDWNGGRYARVETRLVHRVDGFECATDDACDAAANAAMRNGRPGRAVRIWQQVYGVNWI